MRRRALTPGPSPDSSRRGRGGPVGFDRMAAFEELCVRSWRRQLLEAASARGEGKDVRREEATG